MFKCHAGHITSKGVKRYSIVAETREKTYPERFRTHGDGSISHEDMGGEGWEIVEEIFSCAEHIPKGAIERVA